MIARVTRFVTTVARHGVPIGGIFARDWHPVTAVGVYWVESVLLVLATASLCVLIQRRTSPTAIHEARADGDRATARALEVQREELKAAAIQPRDVLVFHLGSLLVFGAFFALVILVMVGNGRLEEPIRWREFAHGAEALLVVVAIGLTIDLWTFNRFSVAQVRARVDACLTRWALFWLLGFFAVLKTTFESWAGLARLFGWKSLNDREAAGGA
jgi:hypothetical protein